MKFSKAAIKSRQIKVAHLTALGEERLRDEPPAAPARRYSTEWRGTPISNGIDIPKIVRDQIEAAASSTAPETTKAPKPEPLEAAAATFHGWGFFGS
jgi:hypothetical protein